jgi:pantoate--beta-alanine ligase
MKIFKTIIETQNYIKSNSVGFVPTMGALHLGHISLVKQAKLDNELCVCSIFVNPTQFNNPADLLKYPRTVEADLVLLEEAGCDVVFIPEVSEMYPSPVALSFHFGRLEEVLEGAFRPGHFNGVGIVVSKLFHIIQPQKAYFGLKDLQQCAIINRLVKDLSFDIELIFCETVREADGLAMSSRNVRLDTQSRNSAPFIYASLKKAKDMIQSGLSVAETQNAIVEGFKNKPEFELEYFEIVDFETLEPIETYSGQKKVALITAAHLGGVRLIDNLVI